MSTPDPNPSPSVPVSVPHPIIVTASETPVTQAPSPAPSHRPLAPVHLHPHQNQNQNQNLYTHPLPMRHSNSAANSHHPDPSSLIFPFGYSGQGFQTRPGRHHSNPVADSAGYPTRPVYAYHPGQYGSNSDPVVQFMRAQHPQNQQSPQFGSGHIKGAPHFLQPRVTPSPTSILDNSGHKKARSRDDALVLVRKRKVRITEGASLYSLCRSWLRNGAHEGIQPQRSDTMTCLPKPLPVDKMETSLPKESVEEPNREEDKEDEEAAKQLSESDLLKKHVDRAKNVRARLREERLKKIARYKTRLALLLPPYGEQCRE